MRAHGVVLACGVLVAALLTGNPAAVAAPDEGSFAAEATPARKAVAEEDGLRIDAASYATDYGVGASEAVSRLAAQKEYGQLVERVALAYPDSFAGSTIDHGKSFGLQLYFTGAAPAGAVERTVASTKLSRPSVRVDRSAKLTAAQSVALVEAVKIPEQLAGAVDGISYDVATNTVTLDVASTTARSTQTATVLDTAVAAAARSLAVSSPRIALNSKGTRVSDGHSGGLHLTTCTTGFAVSVGGTQGITTAGHCGDTQSYKNYCCTNWWPIYFQSEARTASADVQWHTTNIGVFPRFTASSETSYRTLTGSVLRTGQAGHYVCHRGKTTAYSCGTVQSNAYRLTYANACPGTTCNATWVRLTGASLLCYPGDSGGVVFNAYNAYGLYKGQASSGTAVGDCSEMFYMPIDYISAIGATLLFG
jgi:hypothetical protein